MQYAEGKHMQHEQIKSFDTAAFIAVGVQCTAQRRHDKGRKIIHMHSIHMHNIYTACMQTETEKQKRASKIKSLLTLPLLLLLVLTLLLRGPSVKIVNDYNG